MERKRKKKKKEKVDSLLDLFPNLHGRVDDLLALVPTEVELLSAQRLGLVGKRRDGREVVVAAQVPEEGAADADQRALRERLLALLDRVERLLVDYHFMVFEVAMALELEYMQWPHWREASLGERGIDRGECTCACFWGIRVSEM